MIERPSTWINTRISALYNQLHAMGFCHSIECRDNAGQSGWRSVWCTHWRGFLSVKACFLPRRDASKVALVHLVARLNAGGFRLLDTQFVTDHLKSFGCLEIPRDDYRGHYSTSALLATSQFLLFLQDDDNPDCGPEHLRNPVIMKTHKPITVFDQ